MRTRVWLPVSIRWLVPEIDRARAVHGRPVDILHTCYRAYQVIDGRDVPYEYFFTTCPTSRWYYSPDLPLSFWSMGDDAWRDKCRWWEPADGTTPCPYDCSIVPPTPLLPGWQYPEILTAADDILVSSALEEIWWY